MKKTNMKKHKMKDAIRIATLSVAAILLAALLAACGGSGAGGGSSSTGSCTATGDYTVEWKFSGSYSDGVSVATTWIKPSGEISDPTNLKYVTIDPSTGTLLTETLPGCSGASINITMLDETAGDDIVALTNVTLSIYVDGTEADSVTFNGTYPDGAILPNSGALVVVVGQ